MLKQLVAFAFLEYLRILLLIKSFAGYHLTACKHEIDYFSERIHVRSRRNDKVTPVLKFGGHEHAWPNDLVSVCQTSSAFD
ncbi:hypothetical protein WI70_14770 [Burkholderia cepacia]|nr:hypothetical protein WI47_20505 [Burkholderia cepacia]KVC20749.1 hypothetical protein WI70_14770 [Burkholderia cepacia]